MKLDDATPARVRHVANRLRYQDRMEARLSHNLAGDEAVWRSWQLSRICRCIGADDGEPVGICGVSGTSIWMLGTDKLTSTASHRRSLVVDGRAWVESLLAGPCRRLENWALASNGATLLWLRHLGFTIDPPAPYGPYRLKFCHFWREVPWS